MMSGVAPAPQVKPAPKSSGYSPITSTPVSYTTDLTEYQNADGLRREVSLLTPINFQRSDGNWVPIGTTIASDSATGGYTVADNPLHPEFAAASGSGADVSVNTGSYPLLF